MRVPCGSCIYIACKPKVLPSFYYSPIYGACCHIASKTTSGLGFSQASKNAGPINVLLGPRWTLQMTFRIPESREPHQSSPSAGE